MIRATIAALAVAALAGCSTAPACYVEVGAGAWLTADGTPGKTPSQANAYCQRGPWSAGVYHTSDIARGRPFNSQEETSTDSVLIKYRKRVF